VLTVATALACRFPTVLWLGDQLRLVYNDGYIPMLGDKHLAALALPARTCGGISGTSSAASAGVVATGKATWSDDLKLMLVNDGCRRERYFTFTHSPIIGAGGAIEGVFCAVAETTERVLSERRLGTLSTLAAAVMDAQAADLLILGQELRWPAMALQRPLPKASAPGPMTNDKFGHDLSRPRTVPGGFDCGRFRRGNRRRWYRWFLVGICPGVGRPKCGGPGIER
jgi:hypothetical protein